MYYCEYPENCIEDFQVYEILGRGGFAEVYRAKSLKTDQEVAIKMIDKRKTHDHGMTKRVRKEVELHSRLKHPSILELYTFFENSDYVYLVLEMCHNGELQRKIKENGPLSEKTAREYLKQIVDGLKYLHSYNILHRDLTLANLLLTKDSKIKIADFGLATKLEIGIDHFTMCGTPNYISPEVVNRSRQGLESDVWSLGCMLYTMLVGKAPFDTKEIKGTLHRVQQGTFDLPIGISDCAKDLIGGLLQTDPDKRLNLQQLSVHAFMQTKKAAQLYQEISISDSGIESMSKGHISRDMKHSLHDSNTFDHHHVTPYRQSSVQCYMPSNNSTNNTSHTFKTPQHSIASNPCMKSSQSLSFTDHKASQQQPTNNRLETTSIRVLSSKRLRPIRQETRNAILNILDDESVCVEFVKNHFDRTRKIIEVMCIDSSGRSILIYNPVNVFQSNSDRQPTKLRPGDTVAHYNVETLPEKYWKKYELAKRFVDLVKTRTPKLTLYTKTAKCMLMENEPCADFEVVFDCDRTTKCDTDKTTVCKIHYHGETGLSECIYENGSIVNVDSKTNVSALSASLNRSLEYADKCREHCIKIVTQMKKVANSNIQHSPFPITLGRRCSLTNIPPNSIHAGLISINDLPSAIVDNILRNETNSLNLSSAATNACCNTSFDVPVSTFIPEIGWATQKANGELTVQFNDGCQLIIVYDSNNIEKIRWGASLSDRSTEPLQSMAEFSRTAILPDEVHSKLELLPLFVKQIRTAVSQRTANKS